MTIEIFGFSINLITIGAIVFIFVLFYLVWKFSKGGFQFKGGGGASTLETYGKDLTALAREKKLDPVIGRDKEIIRVTQILSRRTKDNPILLGEPGVGKTAIVEGLARKIIAGDVPHSLLNKRVIALDITSLISGTKYRGEFEKRLKQILVEIEKSNRTIVLFIDEIHMLTESKASEGALNPADILKPALARGWLQTIGATTYEEYKEHIVHDETLERRFQPVQVDEPSVEDTIKILHGVKENYAKHHQVQYTDEAISASAILAEKYIKERFLPDKAIDVIDEAAAAVSLEHTGQEDVNPANWPKVDIEHVRQVVADWAHIPKEQIILDN